MSCKTILVYVDASEYSNDGIEVAAKMAARDHAHLIGIAVTGLSRSLHRPVVPDQNGISMTPYKSEYLETLRLRANAALDKFEALARGFGVTSYERRLIEDEASAAISAQGLYADLIVLGRNDSDDPSLTTKVDFPEYVILNSECPVLIVPRSSRVFGNVGMAERVLIAWDGSLAASRAVRNAMPFLILANNIQLAIVEPASRPNPQCEESGKEIAAYLMRHSVKVKIVRHPAADDAGHALLALAADLSSDLIVMGCVAHPRWRGVLLGGTTRVVLEETTVAVLMSH